MTDTPYIFSITVRHTVQEQNLLFSQKYKLIKNDE